MPTPVFVAAASAEFPSGTAASVTIPGSAAAGNHALLVVAAAPGTITTNMTAAGWTTGPTTSASPTASGGRLYTYSRTLQAEDIGATVSITLSGSSRTAIGVLVTSAANVDVSAADPTNTNGTAVTAPSVSPTTNDGLLVCVHGTVVNTQSVTTTWTPDPVMTERIDVCTSSISAGIRNSTFMLATQALAASGATGTRTATSTQTMQRQGISLVLAGVASGPTVTVWDGTAEQPATMEGVWNGTTIAPATVEDVT